MVRTVLFHRKFRRFHGGHLKVWHYFNHSRAAPGFDARVLFDVDSSWDASNPWREARDAVIDTLDGVRPDVLFVAGRDWQRLERLGLLDRGLPILNLVQHVRHADDWSIQSRYLGRRAVRICVSEEVEDAVREAGAAGPIVVIPNAVDIPEQPAGMDDDRPVDVFVAGLKQPALAARLAELVEPGLTIETAVDHLPREQFLDAMRRARVTLFLPNEEEGFYLPALEGMALGTIVVCPDCLGNRAFCLPGITAFRPAYRADDLLAATREALRLPEDAARSLRDGARSMAQGHSPAAERATFQAVLADLDAIWLEGH